MKQTLEIVRLEKIVGGGQALGTFTDGRKCFVWGGLPDELVEFQVTKKKSKLVEGVVTSVLEPSPERIEPKDSESYLSTSPWQVMSFEAEQTHKAGLIREAFELHHQTLPDTVEAAADKLVYGYRNKVEFSWYGHEVGDVEQLDLAFFRRGSKGKLPVEGTSLARKEINVLARIIRDVLRTQHVTARSLKTLLIRCNQQGSCVWQLYIKDENFDSQNLLQAITKVQKTNDWIQGGEVIYSDPRSPASRITKRLASIGDISLTDTILGVPFRYATEGFFQINLPVYEQALKDMRAWTSESSFSSIPLQPRSSEARPEKQLAPSGVERKNDDEWATVTDGSGERKVVDLYSGVGSIGLTIGGDNATLVEINEDAVREMRANITALGSSATAVLAPSEKALDYITSDALIIVDPPRAGLHASVVDRLLETKPPRILYLSCNPVTQARDVALLTEKYTIRYHKGYNFFPRTPHIEHLVVLDLKP